MGILMQVSQHCWGGQMNVYVMQLAQRTEYYRCAVEVPSLSPNGGCVQQNPPLLLSIPVVHLQ